MKKINQSKRELEILVKRNKQLRKLKLYLEEYLNEYKQI